METKLISVSEKDILFIHEENKKGKVSNRGFIFQIKNGIPILRDFKLSSKKKGKK